MQPFKSGPLTPLGKLPSHLFLKSLDLAEAICPPIKMSTVHFSKEKSLYSALNAIFPNTTRLAMATFPTNLTAFTSIYVWDIIFLKKHIYGYPHILLSLNGTL